MSSPAIDYSAGLVKTAPPQSGGVDYSAGMVPTSGQQPPATPAPSGSAPPTPKGLAYNGNGEGTYKMKDPSGADVAIPYSNVGRAIDMGHRFADQDSLTAYARDHAADPISEDRVNQWIDKHPYMSRPLQGLMGAGTGVLKTASGLNRVLGRSDDPATQSQMQTRLDLAAATPTRTAAEGGGEAAEGLAEFFSGEELASLLGKTVDALPLTQRLKSLSNVAQLVEKAPPMVQKLIKIGMSAVKQGTIGGAQTYVKTGGDAGAAAASAAATAGAGAVLGAAGEGLSSAIARNATTLEDVGGVPTPVSAEVRNARPTPQQAAGQEAIGNAARGSVTPHLEEANESRSVPASPPALPASTGPYEFNLRGVTPEEGTSGQIAHPAAKFEPAASRVPEGGTAGPQNRAEMGSQAATIPDRLQKRVQAFTPAIEGNSEAQADVARGAGTLKTQDANIASAHVANLNRIVDGPDFENLPEAQQQQILEARADAMKQLGEYHQRVTANLPNAGKPNFAQINIPETVKRVGSYTDAANQLENVATDGYEHFNDITGGKFNALRQANKNAWAAYKGASSLEAQQAAQSELEKTDRQMQQLMTDIRGAVTPKELSGFNNAYRNAQSMHAVAAAVDGSFSGNASTSARSWEYRGFDGNRLMSNLSRLQQKMGRGPLERVVGRDNLNTLFQVAELNRTGTARARFGVAIKPVVQSLLSLHVGPIAAGGFLGHMSGIGYEAGAAAGWATAAATKRVMNAVLTNPQVAKNLIFAIDSGANAEHYGPMLATMIQQQETEASKQRQADQSREGDNQ